MTWDYNYFRDCVPKENDYIEFQSLNLRECASVRLKEEIQTNSTRCYMANDTSQLSNVQMRYVQLLVLSPTGEAPPLENSSITLTF